MIPQNEVIKGDIQFRQNAGCYFRSNRLISERTTEYRQALSSSLDAVTAFLGEKLVGPPVVNDDTFMTERSSKTSVKTLEYVFLDEKLSVKVLVEEDNLGVNNTVGSSPVNWEIVIDGSYLSSRAMRDQLVGILRESYKP